ncbi:MAG: tetratricopeptide repeat protein [Bacteroidales bacterium]|nr:tetratricopeptide repeat protein [Bacteroidales bacterium]
MKQSILILLIMGMAVTVAGQKSRVMAVKQLIDGEKYEEAKEFIELAIWNDKTSRWPRTYYTKGWLCQTAYEAGVKKNDAKLINLFPDQLYVAYDAYEKALELDAGERLHTIIRQNYYLLSNDFRSLGEKLYKKGDFKEALRAFEHALLLAKSDLISAKTDTSLVYNTAMAAYESKNWEKATAYLSGLHEDAYSSKASLLLSMAFLNVGDTIGSDEVLMEGVKIYRYEESMVMYLVNNLVSRGRAETAITVLDSAIVVRPDNFRFLWARGLVFQQTGQNEEAIENFLKAVNIYPDEAELYYHLGLSYYNIGIELRESASHILENNEYLRARELYLEKFREAIKWLERSYELNPQKEEAASILFQLYNQLQMK